MIASATIFFVTYLLIAERRLKFMPLDRPAGALLGAVACVVFRVLTPKQAIDSVNAETILLLFGLMGMGAFLAEGGFLERAADWMVAKAKSPARLLGLLVWGAGLLAPLITNDAVCVLLAPVVVAWIDRHRLPPLPFLIGLATAANTGSVATLVGNPQNMLCGTLGHLVYRTYLFHMAPVALIGLAINHAMLALMFRKQLDEARFEEIGAVPKVLDAQGAMTLGVIVLTVIAYLTGADLAWTAVAGFTALLLAHRADPTKFWGRIDWSILLFFGGLFVVVGGLVQSGTAEWVMARFPLWSGGSWTRTAAIFLVGSNVVSNVPFILVVSNEMGKMPNPTLAWEMLAMASTFAGNLTLLGSVANIIVAERGRAVGGLTFIEYARVGVPLATITTALGTVWLLFVHP